jgi:hypothetical protein
MFKKEPYTSCSKTDHCDGSKLGNAAVPTKWELRLLKNRVSIHYGRANGHILLLYVPTHDLMTEQRTSQLHVDLLRFIDLFSRLYWYRGVTVLLPGWVIWKNWNYPCKFFSLGSWLVSALSTPNGGEG